MHVERGYAREDLAALRWDAAAGTQSQCDHLHGSDLVISACGKCGMPERSWQLFDEMRQQGLMLNVITYTAVIWSSVHVESAVCRGGPCCASIRCSGWDSSSM